MLQAFIGIVNFIIGILLIPAVKIVAENFYIELHGFQYMDELLWGVFGYVVFHLFIFTPQAIFQSGQKVVTELFKLFPFLGRIISKVIPFLATLILIFYYIWDTLFDKVKFAPLYLWGVGFSFAMHIILSAHESYEADTNPLKPRYLCSVCLAFICSLLVVAVMLELCFPKFSAWQFMRSSYQECADFYVYIFGKLLG